MRRQWTEEEVEYLEKYYEKRGVDYIAKKLKRSVFSVRRKAQNLGYNAYICEELYVKMIARCFNCDSSVIIKWINNHNLPCRIVQRGQATCRLIDTKEFWKWAKNNKDLIPWSKYERFSILPEPAWVIDEVKSYAFKNNRKKLTQMEKQRIINLRKQGKTFQEIALDVNRTIDSVKHVWRKREGSDI